MQALEISNSSAGDAQLKLHAGNFYFYFIHASPSQGLALGKHWG